MLNFFKPTIQNESIKELVDALNNVKSFQDSDLHLKGFANQLSLIHLKRIILMAYEENEDIELSAAVEKNLNRFLRLQGKFALQILKEAIEETRDTNYFFQIPESEEIGVMLASSFDDKEFEDLTVEQVANGPAEYSSWNGRNC